MVRNRLQPSLEGVVEWGTEIRVSPNEVGEGDTDQFCRKRATQRVESYDEVVQTPEVAEFGRDRAGQLIVPKPELLQEFKAAEFGRNRAGQLVFGQRQYPEILEGRRVRAGWGRSARYGPATIP